MSKVALRLYNREIEALIDQGHYDEAIAHCKHVLKTYPKYLEAYRLLGKAHLEARHFNEAADIFQRVLLAVPDDFVSHLAMSIIHDEQKDLDRAIWHMERAYEVYPSNAGVQNELRRLYGRRDGLEPPKIRLTRGALAQMYTKGGQYQQAIVEIKAVLAEDPTRYDLRTLLARAYFRAGMKVEATEICTELLRQYPYHLDANRILVEILPGTSLAGSIEQYKKRVQSLDPYAAYVSGSLFESDNVPDNAVQIERLDYDALPQETAWQTPTQPAATPGLQPAGQEIPEWLQQAGWGPATGTFDESAITFEEPEPPAAPQSVEIAQAEIPDWLKAMAPAAEEQPPAETPVAEDLDWLSGLGGPLAESDATPQPPAPAESTPDWMSSWQPQAESSAPAGEPSDADLEWLSGLGAPQPEKPQETTLSGLDEMPDWLSSIGESPSAPASASPSAPSASADLPDWLSGIEEAPSAPASASPSAPSASADLPDWLSGIEEAPSAPASASVSASPASLDEDEALRWLEALAVRQGAKPEELLTRPEERSEELPAWLSGMSAETETKAEARAEMPAAETFPWETEAELPSASSAPSVPASASPASASSAERLPWELDEEEPLPAAPLPWQAEAKAETEAELPSAPSVPASASPSASSSASVSASPASLDEDEALRWLEALAARQGAKPEELLTRPEERSEELPAWLNQFTEEPQPSVQPAAPAVEAYTPEKPIEIEAEPWQEELSRVVKAPGTAPLEQDEALKWLESLAEQQGARAEELLTPPAERTSTPPAWLGAVQNPPTELSAPVSAAGTSTDEQDEALRWLEALAARQGAKPEELLTRPEERSEELPAWLSGMSAETETKAEARAEMPAAETFPWETEAETEAELSSASSAPSVPASASPASASSAERLPWELDEEEPLPAAPLPWETEAETKAELPSAPSVPPSASPSAPSASSVPASVSPSASSASPASLDEDEALRWLEALAARQGAKPEELLTRPEERSEELPAWLSGVSAEAETKTEARAEMPAAETFPWETEAETQAELPSVSPSASPSVSPSASPAERLPWELDEEEPLPAAPLPWETEAETKAELPSAPSVPPSASPSASSASEDLPDWLNSIEEAPSVPASASSASEDLPDWLNSLDETPSAPSIPASASPSVPESVSPSASTSALPSAPSSDDVSAWLENLTQPAEASTPAVRETQEDTLPDWLKDMSADEETPLPATISQWVPAEEPPAPAENRLEPVKPAPAAPKAEDKPAPPRLRLRSTSSLQDRDAAFINKARELLDQGRLDDAMNTYGKLIKKGKLLEEIIEDLNEIVYRHPVDVIVWQTMGDAYMRANRLQEALDAYTKAEELLR